MIKQSLYKEIIDTLEKNGRFCSSDFQIETSLVNSNTVLTIQFKAEPKYYISINMPSSLTQDRNDVYNSYYLFTGKLCPGPLAYTESFTFKESKGIFSRISEWTDDIWEELISNPVVRNIVDKQKEIDDFIESYNQVEDAYFTIDEVSDVKSRLDNLEKTLSSELRQTIEDKKELEKELSRLKNDIETLKQSVSSLKKKGWLKSFASKVFRWTKNSENRKALKDGYTIVREFLPEEYKNALPDVKD